MTLDYFYGQAGELFSFYRIPKALFQEPRFQSLSTDAKTLYGILLDRMSLSVKNGWLDKQNRVFILFTIEDVKRVLCCADNKATKLLRELEKFGLIERKRRGQGKPSLVYVKNFSAESSKESVKNRDNDDSCGFKIACQDPAKSRCNKTKENDTEMSETDLFYSEESDGMSKRTQLEEYFSQSLEVELLLRLCPDDEDIIYQIVDLLVDTCATKRKMLRVAGDDRPAEVVRSRFMKLNADHIKFVLKCLAENSSPAASQMEKRGIRTDKGEVNRQIVADNKLLKEIKARITRLYRWSKAEAEKPQTQQSSLTALWEAQQQLNAPRTRTGKIRALQESAALFSFLQANGIQSMQQLHEKIADMNSRYYDLRGKIVKAERRIATLTERGEMWEQYNQYKSIHKQLAKVKPEKREQFEQRHSRELILYDAAARYLKELKDSGEGITPKAWQREIDQLAAGKQTDTLAMKSMREELKAVERLRKTAEQLSRQERDKSHDRGPER